MGTYGPAAIYSNGFDVIYIAAICESWSFVCFGEGCVLVASNIWDIKCVVAGNLRYHGTTTVIILLQIIKLWLVYLVLGLFLHIICFACVWWDMGWYWGTNCFSRMIHACGSCTLSLFSFIYYWMGQKLFLSQCQI